MKKNILGIEVEMANEIQILEKIKEYIKKPENFFHIVSLNPEILIIAQKNKIFKKVLQTAQIKIIDGAGVYLLVRLFGAKTIALLKGVDLMEKLFSQADKNSLRVMLIGGRPKIAERVIKCQKQYYPSVDFFGFEGIENIKNPKPQEEEKIFSIVADFKPHFLFVAFGSPFQELWLYQHQEKLRGTVCMGVGGAFDYLSGAVYRAPLIIRKIGLEWFFRLIIQPWRIKRQWRLIEFIWLLGRKLWRRRFIS